MGIMLGLFAAVLALVLLNVPIAVSLGVVALIAMVATHGTAILPNLAVVASEFHGVPQTVASGVIVLLFVPLAKHLVLAGVKQAIEDGRKMAESEMKKVTGGMDVPGMPF